ncbi:hypothetical protein NN561_009696 [Cricetulus griseus]
MPHAYPLLPLTRRSCSPGFCLLGQGLEVHSPRGSSHPLGWPRKDPSTFYHHARSPVRNRAKLCLSSKCAVRSAFPVPFTDQDVEKFLNSFKAVGLFEWRRQRFFLPGSSHLAAPRPQPRAAVATGGALGTRLFALQSGTAGFRGSQFRCEPNTLR